MLLSHLGESTSQIGILPLKVKLLLGLVIAYIALIDIEQVRYGTQQMPIQQTNTLMESSPISNSFGLPWLVACAAILSSMVQRIVSEPT